MSSFETSEKIVIQSEELAFLVHLVRKYQIKNSLATEK